MINDVHQRLENIRTILHSFKVEQEQLILKFNDEYKFRLSRPSAINNGIVAANALGNPAIAGNGYQYFHTRNNSTGGYLQPASGYGVGGQSSSEINAENLMILSKIMNLDSIIMPVGSDLISNQRLWPQALNGNFRDLIVKIGSIESHGSLWKLIPRKDNLPGQRIILQAAEIGEEVKYLSPTLQLVELKADAAVWNIKLHEPPRDINDQNNFYSNDATKGITVVFEYYGVGNGGNNGNNNASIAYEGMVEGNAAAGYDLLPPKEGSLLICSYSHLSSAGELQVMSKEDIQHTSTDEYQLLSYIWEICPESWINEDMEFLEKYL